MKVSMKFICKRCVGHDNILPPKHQNHNFPKQLNKNNKSASAATCQSYSEWNYLSIFALPYNISQATLPLPNASSRDGALKYLLGFPTYTLK